MPEEDFYTNKTVLIVEDDVMLRDMLAGDLKLSFNVLEADNGKAALKEVLQNKPDAIVLDLLLPGLDGFGLLEQLRANSDPAISGIKVVVLSNLSDAASIERAKALSISSYLLKTSTSLDRLAESIKDALRALAS